jgi:hypothetical protein
MPSNQWAVSSLVACFPRVFIPIFTNIQVKAAKEGKLMMVEKVRRKSASVFPITD